jgi:hypothetical protein
LQQDSGDRRVRVQLVDDGGQPRLLDVGGQVAMQVAQADAAALPPLVANVELRGRVVADQQRDQPGRLR